MLSKDVDGGFVFSLIFPVSFVLLGLALLLLFVRSSSSSSSSSFLTRIQRLIILKREIYFRRLGMLRKWGGGWGWG